MAKPPKTQTEQIRQCRRMHTLNHTQKNTFEYADGNGFIVKLPIRNVSQTNLILIAFDAVNSLPLSNNHLMRFHDKRLSMERLNLNLIRCARTAVRNYGNNITIITNTNHHRRRRRRLRHDSHNKMADKNLAFTNKTSDNLT